MFKKILIANRGEIAVRIIRTCREMGIGTVALYDASDRGSLHVRLADECMELPSASSFMDKDHILGVAAGCGADAIHPGYGYLAEDSAFIEACSAAGIAFIGPPAETVALLRDKVATLEMAAEAGLKTPAHSPRSYDESETDLLREAANAMGYPLVIKSCSGGRGRGERLVMSAGGLEEAVRRARVEARAVYGSTQLYLERAIMAAHQVGVQILGDCYGNIIHLGDREGSLIMSNQKLLEEAPSPCLTPERREVLRLAALDLARRVNYRNAGTVEFLVDEAGEFYFSEIKARIQIEHTLTEALTRLDLVREQIRLAAGEPLGIVQEDVWLGGWAMMARVLAQDPGRRFMPSPGPVRHVRLPAGPEVRVDTYVYGGADVPAAYDPLIAKVTVWAPDRQGCVHRLRRALEDFALIGAPTNLPFLQRLAGDPAYVEGIYSTDRLQGSAATFDETNAEQADAERLRRDLAVAAAIVFARRREALDPQQPDRWSTGWHRTSRQLPG